MLYVARVTNMLSHTMARDGDHDRRCSQLMPKGPSQATHAFQLSTKLIVIGQMARGGAGRNWVTSATHRPFVTTTCQAARGLGDRGDGGQPVCLTEQRPIIFFSALKVHHSLLQSFLTLLSSTTCTENSTALHHNSLSAQPSTICCVLDSKHPHSVQEPSRTFLTLHQPSP